MSAFNRNEPTKIIDRINLNTGVTNTNREPAKQSMLGIKNNRIWEYHIKQCFVFAKRHKYIIIIGLSDRKRVIVRKYNKIPPTAK
jgi:hypothetical protein